MNTLDAQGTLAPVVGTIDPYEIAAQEDRCAPRTRIAIPAKLRFSGGRRFHTVVHDLSLSGFSANSINRMQPESICWLTLPELEAQECKVIWWEDNLVGCAFQNLLNPIIHDHILTRYRTVEYRPEKIRTSPF